LFAVFIWRPRLGSLMFVIWGFSFLATQLLKPELGDGLIGDTGRAVLSPYNLLFLAGIGVAWIIEHRRVPYARLLAATGFLAFISAGLIENARMFNALMSHDMVMILVYGLSSMFMILGLVAAERTGKLKLGRIAATLGSLSYPLYLTHGMTMSAVLAVFVKMGMQQPDWLLLIVATAIACIAALFVHRWIELPIARYLAGRQEHKLHTVQCGVKPRSLG